MCWGNTSESPDRRPMHEVPGPLSVPTTGLAGTEVVHWRLLGAFGFPTVGMIIRKDVLVDIGGFDVTQRRRHDFELFLRAALLPHRLLHVELHLSVGLEQEQVRLQVARDGRRRSAARARPPCGTRDRNGNRAACVIGRSGPLDGNHGCRYCGYQ